MLPGNSWAAGLLALLLLPATLLAAAPGPADVVQAFNRAISARQLEDATVLLAKGSVQDTLRAAHAGVTTGGRGITSDLKTHWSTIGPVLFAVTTTCKRRQDRFSEVYLLVHTANGWQIGAIADNRGTDSLPVAATGRARPGS